MSSQMRIAYVLVCYDAASSGVYKKIQDQVTAWKSAGHSVQLFVITDRESVSEWRKLDASVITLTDTNFVKKYLNRLRILKLADQPTTSIIYLRDSFPIWLPRTSTPTAIEVQSLVGQELKLRSKGRYLFFKLLKKPLYSRVSGAVYVTEELWHKNEFQVRLKIPKIAIGNGIDFDRITSLPPRPNSKPTLFFVGSPSQPWHGVQELVEFAKLNPDIQVEVVGENAESPTSNIVFHGFLRPEEYRLVATRCIAGVGTLNLSVKNMTEASPLKVREYLALGLPVILKYKDVDLDSSEEYVLQLPNDGRRLSEFSAEIRSFLEQWSAKRVLRSQIANIDVSAKEQIRLGFFEKIVSQHAKENPGGLK